MEVEVRWKWKSDGSGSAMEVAVDDPIWPPYNSFGAESGSFYTQLHVIMSVLSGRILLYAVYICGVVNWSRVLRRKGAGVGVLSLYHCSGEN